MLGAHDCRTKMQRSFQQRHVHPRAMNFLLLIFAIASAEAFGVGSSYGQHSRRSSSVGRVRKQVFVSSTRPINRLQASPRMIYPILYKANSSTKWWVTLANLVGLWSRPKNFIGPFIVTGVILASYLTAVLKQLINQGRPDDAPFTDPGMPSSHALTCFFLAHAWRQTYTGIDLFLWGTATTVALLRVVCGYHTFAQIAVGAALGVVLGQGWMMGGLWLYGAFPTWTFRISWLAYVAMSLLFLQSNMTKWTKEERDL